MPYGPRFGARRLRDRGIQRIPTRSRAKSIAISPAVDDPPAGEALAIVAPHAGLMYSGPIAAHAYSLLRGRDIEVAVLVGPSHYVGFEGVAIYERGAFETPFGQVPIAEECAAAVRWRLLSRSNLIRRAHGREHSLEMQLPFLKRVLPDTDIVPLVMGHQQRDTAVPISAMRLPRQPRAGVRCSSRARISLTIRHALVAAKLDGKVIQQVERFDPDGLMSLLEAFPEHACGGGPTVSVMRAAKRLGARDARVLKYGDSGDVSGDKDAVVGYLCSGIRHVHAAGGLNF